MKIKTEIVLRQAFYDVYMIKLTRRYFMERVKPMINVDGVVSTMGEATIPVVDRGFLYGDSVYETFRTEDGIPLFLSDHFNRLENSARLIEMHIDQDRVELIKQIRRTVANTGATRKSRLYVRFQITRGEGPLDLVPSRDLKTRYVIIVKEAPIWKTSLYSVGLNMMIPTTRRNSVTALDPNIKGGNYLNNIMAVNEAIAKGSDDAVMLTQEGYVSEASNSNVWFVIKDELKTPCRGNLKGLTKMHVHKALELDGVISHETDIHVEDVVDATECFVTSATRDVMPCASLILEDGHRIHFPDGGGPVTRTTMEIFSTYVAQYIENHRYDSLI